ncbi:MULTISPECIES: universal stress protein [unclassified Leifsonia]|uniref:universal stress protein n=1 Tax=unclassified Leifsonia TaxID=2663824 RepID=UPI00036E1083|nr:MULTISPECIES: universal stress protein [unclassified Leifsonia]TDP98938.1 nucleotide-binding universal stress UspA family protein [Leifsonia sp. 115AMFTsu3.1]
MEIRRYIVGVDGSLPSRAAIRWAIGHARQDGAEVTLAHVADDEWGAVGVELIDEVDAGARRLLDEEVAYARSLQGTAGLKAELVRGSPMAVLAALGDAETMLVVGTHKTGFHYGRAFGSRSLQLANLGVGPVAIVPDTESRLRRGVVVGVDDSAAGTAALDVAADLACDHNCELTAVRSSGPSAGADRRDAEAEVITHHDDEARTLLAGAVERIRRRQPGITIRSRVVRRPPGAALNDIARSAEVLVVGDSRREEAQPGGLGSVAYDVLLNVSSPTIVVHAPPAVSTAPEPEGEAHVVR